MFIVGMRKRSQANKEYLTYKQVRAEYAICNWSNNINDKIINIIYIILYRVYNFVVCAFIYFTLHLPLFHWDLSNI